MSKSVNQIFEGDIPMVWHMDGKMDAADKPSIIHADGSEEWFLKGHLQDMEGPAIVDGDGNVIPKE